MSGASRLNVSTLESGEGDAANWGAQRDERSPERTDTRAGHDARTLETKTGAVTLQDDAAAESGDSPATGRECDQNLPIAGTDAPICQDTRSGGLDDLLASAEIGHDSLVDLASEKTFQAPDDLPFRSAVRRAACDVINGRLMVPHADDDGSIEGGVGVSVAASIEAGPAGGHPGRGRDRTRAAELREGGFRTNPVGIIAEDDQQFGRGVGAHTEALTEGR